MSKVDLLLAGAYQPGIYRLLSSVAHLQFRAEVERAGWRFVYLDGNTIEHKADFLKAIAAALNFPAYFGHNWDALEECIQDLKWAPLPGYVLFYDRVSNFSTRQPTEWRTAYAILQSAANSWRTQGFPVYILLRDDNEFQMGLEWL